jgi:Phytanoyl-CoA dioxygenase (PhyH)
MLTEAQLGFFARNGFLHVPRWIDADTCSQMVDHTWTRLPAGWRRDDASTWTGAVADSCHIAGLKARLGLLKFQGGDLVQNPLIEGAFASGAKGGELAHALLGHPLGSFRVRGLYCIAPLPASNSPRGEPHIEAHPSQLIALCYLEDVAPNGGGLHVWPGSHRELYPTLGSKLEHVATPAYEAAFTRWAALEPLEVPGRKGDIVIIHHRLLHAPSVNRSDKLRYGFLCDYSRDDFRRLCAEVPGALWEDWPAMAALPPALRDGPPDYPLAPQAPSGGPKVRKVSFQDAVSRFIRRWSSRHPHAHRTDADPSRLQKEVASVLERKRRPGDVWLALSDSPRSINCLKLYPRGSDLTSEGVRVRVDGRPVPSVCKHDIIAHLEAKPGEHVVEIEGLRRSAWLRVFAVKLPFIDSDFLVRQQVSPGATRLSFRFDGT